MGPFRQTISAQIAFTTSEGEIDGLGRNQC